MATKRDYPTPVCLCGHITQRHRYDLLGINRQCLDCECESYKSDQSANGMLEDKPNW